MSKGMSGSGRPEVSVLLPVYNGGAYLEPALRSLMAQTLRNIEIIVVDDASTDGTPEVLDRLAREDQRIRVERLETNLKLAGASNRGLELVRAPLVARLDADDLAAPTRLEVQKSYMDSHPRVVLVGARVREIDGDGQVTRTISGRAPLHAYGSRWVARWTSPVVHSTYMFRACLPSGKAPRYDPTYVVGQDYDIMIRMLDEGDVVSLPDVLVDFRIHEGSVSGKNWHRQQQVGKEISMRHLRNELPEDIIESLMPLREAFYDLCPADPKDIFDGLRRMVSYDVVHTPSERHWVKRHAAKYVKQTLVRSGLRRGALLSAFLGPGRNFLPAMTMRAAEAKLPLITGWTQASFAKRGYT